MFTLIRSILAMRSVFSTMRVSLRAALLSLIVTTNNRLYISFENCFGIWIKCRGSVKLSLINSSQVFHRILGECAAYRITQPYRSNIRLVDEVNLMFNWWSNPESISINNISACRLTNTYKSICLSEDQEHRARPAIANRLEIFQDELHRWERNRTRKRSTLWSH